MREFDLLAYLAAHPGRVYSRDQLMEAVWGEPFFEDTSTVTVHVRRLRAKLGDDPSRAALHRDGLGNRLQVAAVKRAVVIAVAAFLAGAAAVAVPGHMGADQILLVLLAAAGAALAAALAVRLAMEERSRREIEEARRQLVAAASHDLRTPLASLRLLVESIDDGVATGETRDRYLKEIRTHVGVLSDLIDDLFELSRIEAGDISWTMRQVKLRELIGDTVAAMRAPAGERGVSLAAELPAGELVASANAEKVQRVLFNLIQNAIRHTPADGSVTVRAQRRRRRGRGRGRR